MFATSNNHNMHLTMPKQYRKYFNDPYAVKCNCIKNGKRTIRENNITLYKVGDICKFCKGKFENVKVWILQCSECKPKEDK